MPEVLRLDHRNPKRRVVMGWSSPPGRAPHEGDYDEGSTISIEWKDLVMSPERQIHRTARLIANSHSDADGWVEFEPLVGS